MNIIASGGVSTIDDVKALADMKLYGAIIGKAYYTGAIELREAIDSQDVMYEYECNLPRSMAAPRAPP